MERNVINVRTIAMVVPLCCLAAQAPLQAAEWQIETVDSGGTGRYSSLRIDKDGNAHVSYVVEEAGHQLRYGFWDHLLKKWFTMPVDKNASFCSLTLDSKQRPHISYADAGTASGSRLKYAYWDGSQWKRTAVPLNSDIIAFYTSIVLDAADRPSISFYEYRGARGTGFINRLRVVSWASGLWEVRTIDGESGSGKYNVLAIDPRGHLRLAYANVIAAPGARLATWDGTAWRTEIVDDAASSKGQVVGVSVGMALDKGGAPHLAYWNMNVPLVKYATPIDGRWVTETVDQPLAPPQFTDRNSVAIDEAGRPYISYYDSAAGQLRLAHKEGGRWQVEVVDSGAAGLTSSVQVNGGDTWISYGDMANLQLKVARRTVDAAVIDSRNGEGDTDTGTRIRATGSQK
jgi:hypothetical protein